MASERSKTTNSSCPVVNTHTMLKKVKKSSSYQFKLNYFSDFRALWNSRDCYKYVLRRSCEGLFAFIFPTIFFLKEFCSNVMVLVIYCKIWNFIITFFQRGREGENGATIKCDELCEESKVSELPNISWECCLCGAHRVEFRWHERQEVSHFIVRYSHFQKFHCLKLDTLYSFFWDKINIYVWFLFFWYQTWFFFLPQKSC